MSEIDQIQSDLNFVRRALHRRGRRDPSSAKQNLYWAAYVLIGDILIDFAPRYANIFFLAGFGLGMLLTYLCRGRTAMITGEYDLDRARRESLHFFGGCALALAASVTLQVCFPPLRGVFGGQICVVLIGLVYFLAGVHFDGTFLWLGPIMMAGGIAVGFIPHFPWTILGAVVATGLAVPYFLARRNRGQA